MPERCEATDASTARGIDVLPDGLAAGVRLPFVGREWAVRLTVAGCVVAGLLLAACRTSVDPAVIADAHTAARVRTALVNDASVGELAIEVRVLRGVALLSGIVPAEAHARRAVDLARAVDGVTEVRSTLRIAEPAVPTAPPQAGGHAPPGPAAPARLP